MKAHPKSRPINMYMSHKVGLFVVFNGITFLGYPVPNPSFYKDSSDTIYIEPIVERKNGLKPFLRVFVQKWI